MTRTRGQWELPAAGTGLLVSVRSLAEAEAALLGGAALVDVKDPAAGSLGRATERLLTAVLHGVAGRLPVSAALGELLEEPFPPAVRGLRYAKWGLAGCGRQMGWEQRFAAAAERLGPAIPGCQVVAVAYADWQRAGAPPPDAVCMLAARLPAGAFLVDTWQKDGSTLLDWLSLSEVEWLSGRCRAAGVPVALAGSLGLEQLRQMRPLAPDWFAVRGAACVGGQRDAALDPDAVRQLARVAAGED